MKVDARYKIERVLKLTQRVRFLLKHVLFTQGNGDKINQRKKNPKAQRDRRADQTVKRHNDQRFKQAH